MDAMQKPESSTIPLSPGVYLYKDERGRIIYVGKARVLRRRVLSYFRSEGLPAKTKAMLSHATSIEYLTTTTEKEALLLEASLIKKHRPRYNIVLRDDKQYVLFRLNTKHDFPRLEIVRQARRDGARYFGPFTSALAARETWKIIHRAFALRRCSDKAMKNRVRACLYHFMGQCPAPCMSMVTPQEYNENVRKVCDLLQGRAAPLMDSLREAMDEASEQLEFEKAAILRDQIRAVERTVERQAAVLPGGGDMDAVGLFPADKGLALGIVFVRSGAVTDGRAFYWPGLGFEDAPELLWSFVSQYYSQVTPPPRILLPWLPPDAEDMEPDNASAIPSAENMTPASCTARELLEQALSDRRNGAVRIVPPQHAGDNQLVDMAQSNAREEARRQEQKTELGILDRLARSLHLAGPPHRIECVDVSHTGGQQTRVGLVVFEEGQPARSQYRAYAMPDSGDDYATLYAWVARRLESGPPWPDLLLIDGGRGQLRTIQRALQEAGQPDLFSWPPLPRPGTSKATQTAAPEMWPTAFLCLIGSMPCPCGKAGLNCFFCKMCATAPTALPLAATARPNGARPFLANSCACQASGQPRRVFYGIASAVWKPCARPHRKNCAVCPASAPPRPRCCCKSFPALATCNGLPCYAPAPGSPPFAARTEYF